MQIKVQLSIAFFTQDCTTDKGKRNTVCETVTCTITNLARNNIIQFEVSFRLWRQTLNLPEVGILSYCGILGLESSKQQQLPLCCGFK